MSQIVSLLFIMPGNHHEEICHQLQQHSICNTTALLAHYMCRVLETSIIMLLILGLQI